MTIPVQNKTQVTFLFPLAQFLDASGAALPLSTFADAGGASLYLIDSAGKKSGPFPAILDAVSAKNFNGKAIVYDTYACIAADAGWLQKTWWFQFQAPKGATGTFYTSPLAPFPVAINASDLGTVGYVTANLPQRVIFSGAMFNRDWDGFVDLPQTVTRGNVVLPPPIVGPRPVLQPIPILEQFADFIPSVAGGKLGVNIPPPVPPRLVLTPAPILEQFADFAPTVVSGKLGQSLPIGTRPIVVPAPILEQFADNPQTIIGGHVGANMPPVVAPRVIILANPIDMSTDSQTVLLHAISRARPIRPVIISPLTFIYDDFPLPFVIGGMATEQRPVMSVRIAAPLEAFADVPPFVIGGRPTVQPTVMSVRIAAPLEAFADYANTLIVATGSHLMPPTGPRLTLQPFPVLEQFADSPQAIIGGHVGANIPPPVPPRLVLTPAPILEQFADNPQTIIGGHVGANVPAAAAPRLVTQPVYLLEQFTDFAPTITSGSLGFNLPKPPPCVVLSPVVFLGEFTDFVPAFISGKLGVNIPASMAPRQIIYAASPDPAWSDPPAFMLGAQPNSLPPPSFVTPANAPALLPWMDAFAVFAGG